MVSENKTFRQGEHKKIYDAKLRHFIRVYIIELLTIDKESLNTGQNHNKKFYYLRSKLIYKINENISLTSIYDLYNFF